MISDDLSGYEIKSDLDTFDRFSNQVHAYNRVFDRVTLVIGPALADAAPRVIPTWWGLAVARRDERSNVSIEWSRPARRNDLQKATAIASLLWRDEASQVLHAIGLSSRARAPRAEMFEALCSALDLESLKAHVLTRLVQRSLRSA